MYLACSMNFSKLFCITFSKNLNLLTRASLSSDVLQSDAGFCSCEETSPLALFGCCFSESSLETLWLPAASCVSALCSIFSVQFARPAKPTESRRGPKVVLAHAQWRPLGHDLKSQLSLLLKVAACDCHLCHGFNYRSLRLFVPFTSDLQMASKAVLSSVVFHDYCILSGTKGSRFVRAPGDGTWGRKLLRLRLGESMEITAGSQLRTGATLAAFRYIYTHCIIFSIFFPERNRNPDVSQRDSDDEEQESKWVPQTIKTLIFCCKPTHVIQFVATVHNPDNLNGY